MYSQSIFLENLRLLIELVRNRTYTINEIADVFIKEDKWSLMEEVLKDISFDRGSVFKSICLSAARRGNWELFDKYFSELAPRDKLSVTIELLDEGTLSNKKAIDLIKESFKGLGKVDFGDIDLTHDMAIAFAVIGDYTRARFLTNAFCSLAEAKSKFISDEMFGLLDEAECYNLILYVGDKHRAEEKFRTLVSRIRKVSRGDSLWVSLIDVLSKHKMYSKALELLKNISSDLDKAIAMSLVAERSQGDRTIVEKLIDYAKNSLSDSIGLMTFGVTLRRLGIENWNEIFDLGLKRLSGSVDKKHIADFLETLADSDYKDLLLRIFSRSPEVLRKISVELSRETLKYACSLIVADKIDFALRLLDEYMNKLFLEKREREDSDFVVYYAKVTIKGLKHLGNNIFGYDFHERLRDKLYAVIKELELPTEVKEILDKITDESQRIRAIKRIIEIELYKSKCIVADQLERVFMVPRSLIDDVLSSVAKRLIQSNNITDAISCIERIRDLQERFNILSSVTHRCALTMNRDALITLLKKLIIMKSQLKIEDPIEDIKIRADLAIVFKFSGREKDYKESIKEAFNIIQQLKPSEKFDYNYYKKLAEAYGYLSATFYVLGEKNAEKMLKEALKAIQILPMSIKLPVLAKFITWVTIAGWLPVVYQFVQLKELQGLRKFVATILAENYAFQDAIERSIEEVEALITDAKEKIDIYLSVANILARRKNVEGVRLLLSKIEALMENLDDLGKIKILGEATIIRALIGDRSDAEKAMRELYEKAMSSQDLGFRNEILPYVVATKYVLLRR